MPNLEAQADWVPVREIGIELARGGPDGNMNEQAKALVARTEFLKQEKANKSEIVQGIFEFGTYAEFNAIKAILPNNCTVVINETNTTGTGTWGAGNNRWNGVTLTKSTYDPLTKSLNYTDNSLSAEYKENIYDPVNSYSGLNIAPSGGAIRESTSVEINVFPLQGGETYYLKTEAVINKAYVVVGVSKLFSISAGSPTSLLTLNDTEDPLIKTFVVPFGMNYGYINTLWGAFSVDLRNKFVISLDKAVKVVKNIQGHRVYDEDAHKVLNILNNEAIRESDIAISLINLYDIKNEYSGLYVNRVGQAVSIYTTSSLVRFAVEPGKTYYIKAPSFLLNSCVGLKNSNTVLAGEILHISLLEDHDIGIKKFTVPEGTDYRYALFTTHLSSQNYSVIGNLLIQEDENPAYITSIKGIKINPSSNFETRLDHVEAKIELIDSISPLMGLKWAVIGDSITEKNFRANKNYHDYVSEAVGGMTIYNYGASGHTWGHRSNVPNIITQNPDIITVFLGTNDFGVGAREFGTFKDSAGTATVCGSIELLLTNLVNKFPLKRLGILLPLPRYNSYGIDGGSANSFGYTLRQVSEMIIKYANHYGIPYLDLYNASGLAVYNSTANSYYFTSPGSTTPDGVHPNDLGHELISRKVKKFLEEIY